MTQQRACDLCGFYRQRTDGTPAVFRYGLSRQVQTTGLRKNGNRAYTTLGAGGIDLCDECWKKYAAPKRLHK